MEACLVKEMPGTWEGQEEATRQSLCLGDVEKASEVYDLHEECRILGVSKPGCRRFWPR